jgi:hypothetical protein
VTGHDTDNPVQRASAAQLAQCGVFFAVRLRCQAAAVNQHGAVAFEPLLLLQAGNQLFDSGFIAGD